MIFVGWEPNIVNYNKIMGSLCKGRVNEALNIFKKLGDVDCPPNVSFYNIMFSALWSIGDKFRALGMVLCWSSKSKRKFDAPR